MYAYVLDPAHRRVNIRVEGDPDFESGLALLGRIMADAAHAPLDAVLADARRSHTADTGEEIRGFALAFRRVRHSFRGPIAIVVTGIAQLGVGRMLSALLDLGGLHMAVFREIDEAEAWLRTQQDGTAGVR